MTLNSYITQQNVVELWSLFYIWLFLEYFLNLLKGNVQTASLRWNQNKEGKKNSNNILLISLINNLVTQLELLNTVVEPIDYTIK